MRLPKRGERGFTLIELLIVIAILGVLAAVVIPNVGRFMGAGQEEAAATELASIRSAVTMMMTDQGLRTLSGNCSLIATNRMDKFPDPDEDGATLFGYGLTTINYVQTVNTTGTYTCGAAGNVTQVTTGYE